MVWLASLLMFLVIGGGLVALAVFRHRLRNEDADVREIPPDVLIAMARSREAELASRRAGRAAPRDDAEPARTDGPFKDG